MKYTSKRHTRVVKRQAYQTGTRKSLKRDRAEKAMGMGKRETAWGTTYFESRRNRSDKIGSRV